MPRVDDRRVPNGIFRVLRAGAPWRDLPERHGPRTPVTIIGGFGALLWLGLRRARQVPGQAYRQIARPRAEQPWQESVATRDGLSLTRDASPNEELLAMGEEARRHRWTLTHRS